MAQHPPSPGRPGRQLAVLTLAFVFLFGLMFFSGTSGMSWLERMEPRLGLDLVGGTRVTLEAKTLDGDAPEADALERARQIIESRVNAIGVEEAEVVTEGDRYIVVSLAGQSEDSLRSVGDAAELRFRKVLQGVPDTGLPTRAELEELEATPDPEATEDPEALEEPDATPGPETTPAPAATGEPEAAPPAGGDEGGTAEEPVGTAEEREARLEDLISDEAMAAALAPDLLVRLGEEPELADLLEPFGELDPALVAVLPTAVQLNVPAITCEQLDNRPAGSIQDPEDLVVACEGGFKYLLDASTVLGTDVASANAVIESQTSRWVVSLEFTGEGQDKWRALTRESVFNHESTPFDPTALGEDNRYQAATPIQCAENMVGDQGNCRVAVVLDNEVVSSPQILEVMTARSQITGNFTAAEAQLLASQLRYGALPLTFETQEEQTVTATLGTEYLKAGLLAAAVGVTLVLVYSFFYYRLLGIVIVGSLVLSSLLTYAALVVLGRGIGFTLTLAGISGFIVAVGIAADSFVIYFERLKDEIRDGRTPRSAVPRAWVRARRTIISANAVTLLAAAVLYLLSAGQVRGFAFALGLATVLDLLVVFTFRHPIMTLLSRTRAFLSPTVSGLGRALKLDKQAQVAGPGALARPDAEGGLT